MKTPVRSGIYSITNTLNGHRYIGSSRNVEHRWAVHRHSLRRGEHHSLILQRAWDKYSEDVFLFEMLEETSDVNVLLALEQTWMDNLKPEYNLSMCARTSISMGERYANAPKETVLTGDGGFWFSAKAIANAMASSLDVIKSMCKRGELEGKRFNGHLYILKSSLDTYLKTHSAKTS